MDWAVWASIPCRGTRFFSPLKDPNKLRGPAQPPVQWILGVVSADIKQPDHKAEHSTDVTHEWNSFVTLYMPSWFAQGQLCVCHHAIMVCTGTSLPFLQCHGHH